MSTPCFLKTHTGFGAAKANHGTRRGNAAGVEVEDVDDVSGGNTADDPAAASGGNTTGSPTADRAFRTAVDRVIMKLTHAARMSRLDLVRSISHIAKQAPTQAHGVCGQHVGIPHVRRE